MRISVLLVVLAALALGAGCATTPEPTPTIVVTPRPPAPTATVPPTPMPTLEAEPTAAPGPQAVVTADALNLRAGPGTDYDRLGMVTVGQELEVTGRNEAGDWISVIGPGGGDAWVATEYTRLNVAVESLPVIAMPE